MDLRSFVLGPVWMAGIIRGNGNMIPKLKDSYVWIVSEWEYDYWCFNPEAITLPQRGGISYLPYPLGI